MIRRVLLAFLVFGLAACGDDGVSLEDAVIGTWEFESITGGDATNLVSTLTFTATTVTLVFIAGEDCTEIYDYTLADDGALTLTVTAVSGAGCQDMIGDVITGFTATVTADTLTLVADFAGGTVTQFFRRVN